MKQIVCFDLECSDKIPDKAEIVEFAAVKYDQKKGVIDKLEFRCKPKHPVPQEAIDVHGITNEDLENEKPFSDYALQVAKFFKGCDVAGFNIARYDMPILNRHLNDCGYPNMFKNTYIFDVFELFKKHNSRTLSDAVRYYTGKQLEDAHSALADVEGTLECLKEQILIETAKEKTVDEIDQDQFYSIAKTTAKEPGQRIGFSKHLYYDDDGDVCFGFGKHQGKKVMNEIGYLKWMKKTNDFPTEVMEMIDKIITDE